MANTKTVVPFKGTPEQEEKLKALMAQHRGEKGALMPVMQGAQEIYGYLPIEVQKMISEGMDIPQNGPPFLAFFWVGYPAQAQCKRAVWGEEPQRSE